MSSTQDFTSSRFSIPSDIRAWISRLTGCWLLCIDTEARRISLFGGMIGGLAIDPSLDRTEGPTVRIGLQVPRFTWPDAPDSIGPKLAEIGVVGDAEEPMLEGYSALNFLAGITDRVKLGTLVTGVHYRYPGILIKTATTLDVLSGGRAYLGIGAGWNERESRGLGVPCPPTAERFERLEEALQIAHQMWSGEVKPYAGKHYHLEEAMNNPPPLSRPHPPVMVGGMGEKKTLRLVAQYADACNLFAYGGAGTIRHKLEVLRRHCEDVGRDYEEIERTALGTVN